jgi:UDP-N-acetylmuramyl pentapeptide phosphotransferase/UDP-N-acetylglucosamine-1-phosphate transferase
MSNLIQFILLALSIFLLNKLLTKKNWLCSNTGESHQSFTNKNSVPLSGGFFITIGFIFGFRELSNEFYIYVFLIFLLGVLSDLNILRSPTKRFFLQVLLVFFFVITSNLQLENTRVLFLDYLLSNQFFNYFFVLFCITIVINGNNFIDGLNTLVIGYYSVILLFIYYFKTKQLIYIQNIDFIFLLIFFTSVFLFNFFNKLFIGDSGAYIIGFVFSVLLIKIFMSNQQVSPFFIVLLLWYPCFETLFSIIRKLLIGRSPLKPDQNHLHQLLYLMFKKTFKKSSYFSNVITANLIIIYNILIFMIAAQSPFDSQFQIILIIINILVYALIYTKLFYLKLKKGV